MKLTDCMKYICLSILSALAAVCSIPASAQGNAGAAEENAIIDAAAMYNEKNYDGAVSILEKVIAANPSNDAARYYLGLSKLFKNDLDGAEKEFRAAAELDPGNFWYRYRLASFYAITDRPELTIDMYEKLLADFPKKSELYYNLADLYLSQKQEDKALETIDHIETVFGKSDATAMTRFDLLRRMGRQEEAYSSLEDYNREYSSPQILAILGDYQMSMYNDSSAVAMYREALDLDPGYAPALLGLAETCRITRKYNDYFRLINKFVLDDAIPAIGKSDYLQAIVQRSDPQFLQTFRPQTDTVINNALSVHPGDSSMLFVAGLYYYATERNDLAKKYFHENKTLYPSSLGAAAAYAELLMYIKDWEGLSAVGRESYADFPGETSFLEMASLADYNLGDYGKVLDICNTVISVSPGDTAKLVSAYSTMGDMYYRLEERSKAYKAYDKALKYNPEYLPVLNNYAYYLSLEGRKLKKAYTMSKVTIEKEPDNPTYLDTFAWILFLQGKPLEAKPFFKHAMLYGGKDSATILDHYAEVLYALKEYDLAFVYWNQALSKNDEELDRLEEKVKLRKAEMNRK